MQKSLIYLNKYLYMEENSNDHDVTVIVMGNGHSDLNSNPGWGCLDFQ